MDCYPLVQPMIVLGLNAYYCVKNVPERINETMSPVECSHIFLLPANYCELFSAVK
jgi:hypothetical protein